MGRRRAIRGNVADSNASPEAVRFPRPVPAHLRSGVRLPVAKPPKAKEKILTFLYLEFGSDVQGATPLRDIAVTLVSVDELLRDLAAIAAYPSHPEFRNIEVVAIETRERLKVKLALLAIPADAINAFQDICRDIIVFRERPDHRATVAASAWGDMITRRLSAINASMDIGRTTEVSQDDRLTLQDARRLQQHMDVLLNAGTPLCRVEVKEE